MGYEEMMEARSDFIAENCPAEEDYSYIQLYDYTTENFGIIRIRESDAKKVHKIISEVQKDDSYNTIMFYEALAQDSIDYESVEPERVYF